MPQSTRPIVSFATDAQYYSTAPIPSSSSGALPPYGPELQDEREVGYEDDVERDAWNNDVVCAIDHKNRRVGCAYYKVNDRCLYLMEDAELPDKDIIETRM